MKPENCSGGSSAMNLQQTDHAANYANELLISLNCLERVTGLSDHPAIAWKRSGLLQTTKLMLPLNLVSHVDGALMALQSLSPESDLPKSGALLMGERARLRETIREGRQCAGGYGQLLDTKDGRIALNLVRDDDWGLVPAWLEDYVEDWAGIEKAVRNKKTGDLCERAAEIGLAAAEDKLIERPSTWFSQQTFQKSEPKPRPLIVDLSGLWAGPLASSLLQMTGARVIKVEGPNRPDGMRNGHKGFYSLLNAGKDCVALDFRDAEDLKRLKELLGKADVVIEASRPRALPQLGIIAEDFMTAQPGKIWARLTAYGQSENRIGFGDDIGISAGLATVMERAHGEACFVGDAIADPVNGVHLALAIKAALTNGAGRLIDISMRDCLRYAMGTVPDNLAGLASSWNEIADANLQDAYPMRTSKGVVKPLGADNEIIC